MEKYTLADWRAKPDRSRGTWTRPAAKFKREFAVFMNSHKALTSTDKLIGRLLVDYYNEKYGCAWPSTKTICADTGATARTVNKATAKLHELGLIHKEIGGGWDGSKIRHRANQYYPAFSKITNPETGALVKNGSDLSKNPPETRSNPGKYPAISTSPQNGRGTKSDNRQDSAEVPRNLDGAYSDNVMATAIASPPTAAASDASLAPPSEPDEFSLFPTEGPVGWNRVYWISADELAYYLDLDPFELVEGFKPEGDEIMRGVFLAALADDFQACNAGATFEREAETYEAIISVHAQEERVDLVSILEGHELNEDTTFRVEYWE